MKHGSKDRGGECGSCTLGPAESAVLGGNLSERYKSGPGDAGGGGQRGTAQMERDKDGAPGSKSDPALSAEPQAHCHLGKGGSTVVTHMGPDVRLPEFKSLAFFSSCETF